MKKRRLLISVIILVAIVLIIFIILNIKKTKIAPVATRGDTIFGLLNQAEEFQMKADLLAAKDIYQRLINEFPNSSEIMNWQKKIEDLNIKLLFSPRKTVHSDLYEIKPGDTLTQIAKKFNTTTELIMKSNNLTDDKILAGRKIKVWRRSFSMLLDKSQNMLMLKNNDEIFKTYIVSTGMNNSTPTGTFKIINKLKNPTWFKAGAVVPPGSPENILGSRWLGFDLPGYGIHGTTDPQTLGKQVTQGCVRMSNSDIEELYAIIPVGTEVIIVD